MNFDCIIANPPYGKIGVDVTKNVIKQNPDSNYAMLGTRSMFKPFYADTLACAFVQIGNHELGSNVKLDWGVNQVILLATNGWTEVVDNRKKVGENKVGICNLSPSRKCYMDERNSHLVQMPRADTVGTAATHSRPATLVQSDNKTNLRNGYVYVSFETFEEACECAIDIISWKNPTDSHYRCVRWGFVQELKAHEIYKNDL